MKILTLDYDNLESDGFIFAMLIPADYCFAEVIF